MATAADAIAESRHPLAQTVANVIEKAASQAEATTSAATARAPATRFVSAPSGFKLGNFLWAGSLGVAGMIGQLTWLALRWVGLENAGAWAVAGGLLHVIPYFGPAVTATAIGLAGLMQFDTPATGVLLPVTSLTIATFVGSFVAPEHHSLKEVVPCSIPSLSS